MVGKNTEPIVTGITVNVPVGKVWNALTEKKLMKQWFFDIADFKPEKDFEFHFWGETEDKKKYMHLCKITEVIPEKKLAFTWKYYGLAGETLVSFDLKKIDENKTQIRLTHSGVETFPKEDLNLAKEKFQEGWDYIIGTGMKEYLEKN
jgi:uncharacterized protein YndB with AHSA1/START domain